jgi:TFIIH basal transcription factor complex TTD-A subunit
MVNVTKGVLVECDPAMKQFLLHLDEKLTLGSSFVIQVVKFEEIIVISILNVIKASQLL